MLEKSGKKFSYGHSLPMALFIWNDFLHNDRQIETALISIYVYDLVHTVLNCKYTCNALDD